jgi:hypothetical protein
MVSCQSGPKRLKSSIWKIASFFKAMYFSCSLMPVPAPFAQTTPGRPSALLGHDMITNVNASLDGYNQVVFGAAQKGWIIHDALSAPGDVPAQNPERFFNLPRKLCNSLEIDFILHGASLAGSACGPVRSRNTGFESWLRSRSAHHRSCT